MNFLSVWNVFITLKFKKKKDLCEELKLLFRNKWFSELFDQGNDKTLVIIVRYDFTKLFLKYLLKTFPCKTLRRMFNRMLSKPLKIIIIQSIMNAHSKLNLYITMSFSLILNILCLNYKLPRFDTLRAIPSHGLSDTKFF